MNLFSHFKLLFLVSAICFISCTYENIQLYLYLNRGIFTTPNIIKLQTLSTHDRPVIGKDDQFLVRDMHRHWLIGIDPKNGITHFGLDSEDTYRTKTNLLTDWLSTGRIISEWDCQCWLRWYRTLLFKRTDMRL